MGHRIFAEGHVDRAVLSALEVLNGNQESGRGQKGREQAFKLATTATKAMGPPVVLVIDRNGFNEEQLVQEATGYLSESWGVEPKKKKSLWFHGGPNPFHLVLAGLPADPLLKELGIERFMMDDYLLKLCLTDESLKSFCNGENHLPHEPADATDLRSILDEITASLRRRDIVVNSSKRYIDLIRAVTGFQASRATFAQNLVSRCPADFRDAVFADLKTSVLEEVQ